MLLSSTDIIEHLKNGTIKYGGAPEYGESKEAKDTFKAWCVDNVQPASLDISIGYDTWGVTQYTSRGQIDFRPNELGLDSRNGPEAYYTYRNLKEMPEYAIRILPQQSILVRSEFSLTLPPNIGAKILTRSTAARWGWEVCGSSGWVDPGYSNYLTIRIQNTNVKPSLLFGGGAYAQLAFFETKSEAAKPYAGRYKLDGEWQPESMLPKPLGRKD